MIEKDKQRKLKVLSKIIYILAKIGKILTYIAIPFIVLGMVIIPILMNKIDIKNDRIILKDKGNIISIVEKNDKLVINVKDAKVAEVTGTKDISKIKDFFNNNSNFFNNNSKGTIIAAGETALAFALISIIIAIILLRRVEKLFKNINKNDTPFTCDNVEHIRRIAFLMIINIIIPAVVSAVIELILKVDLNIHFGAYNLIEILALYVLVYIFEYGCKLQQDSKCKIYGE